MINSHINKMWNYFFGSSSTHKTDIIMNITITNNDKDPVILEDFPEDYGVFNVIIRPTTDNTLRPSSHCIMGRRSEDDNGDVYYQLRIKGSNYEYIHLKWLKNSKPSLEFLGWPELSNPTGTTSYIIKFITV